MYYISIQWGKGPHYFLGSPIKDRDIADHTAIKHKRALTKRKDKSKVNPTVRVLQVAREIRDIKKES